MGTRGEAKQLQIASFSPHAEIFRNQDADTCAVDVVQIGQIGNEPKLPASHEIIHALPQERVAIIENEAPAQGDNGHRADATFLDRHHW
jgi:hypothetical protein